MKVERVSLAIVLLCLTGCSVSPAAPDTVDYYEMDSSALKRVRDMIVLPPSMESYRDFIDLGPVEGVFCQKPENAATRSTARQRMYESHEQVTMRAAIIGADAMTIPRCESLGFDKTSKSCPLRISCRSNAFRKSAGEI